MFAVREQPERAAERAAGAERPLQELGDVARIRLIEVVGLAPEDVELDHVTDLERDVGAVADQEAGARGLDERRGRMTLQIIEARVVEVGMSRSQAPRVAIARIEMSLRLRMVFLTVPP